MYSMFCPQRETATWRRGDSTGRRPAWDLVTVHPHDSKHGGPPAKDVEVVVRSSGDHADILLDWDGILVVVSVAISEKNWLCREGKKWHCVVLTKLKRLSRMKTGIFDALSSVVEVYSVANVYDLYLCTFPKNIVQCMWKKVDKKYMFLKNINHICEKC